MLATVSISQPLDSPAAAAGGDLYELRSPLRIVDEPREISEEKAPEPLVISPELAMVCPELRALALQLLPDRDPDGFLPSPAQSRATPVASTSGATAVQLPWVAESLVEPRPASERRPRLVFALAAYAAKQAVSVAVHAATMLAVIASVIILVYFARS